MGFSLNIPVLAQDDPRASLAWAGPVDGIHNIFYSRLEDGRWTPPLQISDSDKNQMIPTLAEADEGSAWIVWTEAAGSVGKLRYAYRFNGEWSPARPIETRNAFDTAASVIVDGEGIPWLVWAGAHEGDDEIFYARWQVDGWSEPRQLNIDDAYPDVLPVLELDESGRPLVSWSGFDGERYVEYSSTWTGSEWSGEVDSGLAIEEETTRANSKTRKLRESLDAATVILPAFLTDKRLASIQYYSDGKPVVMRLYDL